MFILEDDEWYGQLLQYQVSLNPDYEVHLFTSGLSLLKRVNECPDIICTDLGLPDITGEALIQSILETVPETPIIVISGKDDVRNAVQLLRSGAKDYILKDDHTHEMLRKSIQHLLENATLKKEVAKLKEQLSTNFDSEQNLIGNSEVLQKCIVLARKAALSDINVSLTGETGVGKEVFAKAIHQQSKRSKAKFVSVNVAAIPSTLIESELFGFEKGAFTGAIQTRKGKFEEAEGGTLFLDEIGEMDIQLQAKLLRVLQERELNHIGSNQSIPIDIRLITSTHKNLAEEVKAGRFREDLYYRIVGLSIDIPSLRKRGNDILLLAIHFMHDFSAKNELPEFRITDGAKNKLMNHDFPGNVRELKAVIDLACVMCTDHVIDEQDISFYPLNSKINHLEKAKTLEEFELEIILHHLKHYDWNVVRTAEHLKIAKSRIYLLIKENKIIKE
ncbi:MAG: sigma-54 dependent transcriptional regulator [Flavobacteriales bacterium]|nr:sigma-54 dependent transcriptional regulator [Flavobacteriales bacterium]